MVLKSLWALLGALLAVFIFDYIRVRQNNKELAGLVVRANDTSDRLSAINQTCLITLASTRSSRDSDVDKAKLVVIAKYETMRTVEAANKGDKLAKARLADAEWIPIGRPPLSSPEPNGTEPQQGMGGGP
jgi:hypothetical protein